MQIAEPENRDRPLSRPKLKIRVPALLVLAFRAILAACGYPGGQDANGMTREPSRAIDRLHEMYNGAKAHEIYQEAHETLLKSITEEALAAGIKRSQDNYGNVDHVNHRWLSVLIGNPIGVEVVLNRQFQKGEATEEFPWVVDGNKTALVLYQIFPGTTAVQRLEEEPLR